MNIQCLSNKVNLLEVILDECNPGIISLCEHWLTSDQLKQIHIGGYTMVSAFCRSSRVRGGTAIFVSDRLLPFCGDLPELTRLSVEVTFECSAMIFGSDLCVLSVYRSPDGAIEHFFDAFSDVLRRCAKYKHVVLSGDLNVDGLKTDNINVKLLLDITASSGLDCLMEGVPTRVVTRSDGRHSETMIDYIFTSESMHSFVEISYNSISDHSFQLLTTHLSCADSVSDRSVPVFRRCFSEHSMEVFRRLLGGGVSDMMSCCSDDADGLFDEFWNEFYHNFNCCFPLKRIYPSTHRGDGVRSWLTDDIRRQSVKLRDLNWLVHTTGNVALSETYKLLKREHSMLINDAKISKNMKTINNSTNKVRSMWNIINTNLNKSKKAQKQISLSIGGEIISRPDGVVAAFADHFSSVVRGDIVRHFGGYQARRLTLNETVGHSMFFTPVVPEEIEAIIRCLPSGKATGPDEVPVRLIKYCAPELAPIISYIVNVSVSRGKFPLKIKTSSVVPIYKKSDPLDINNYRPISLTSIFSKIIERAVCDRLTEFLDRFGIISERQHGFRTGYSTETAAAELVQYVHGKWEEKSLVAGIFFDLSRAFDTLNHSILVQKLQRYGVRGPIAQWVSSYLENRCSYVRVGTQKSDVFFTDIGTPQGSTIGPLMFLLYVNDLPDNIPDGRVQMYADDTVVIVDAPDCDKLRQRIHAVYRDFRNWCRENYLILNEDKTSVVHFCDVRLRQHIGDIGLPMSTGVDFLGMNINQHMDWKDQIERVCAKLRRGCFALVQLKKCVNRESLISAYYAMIYSAISYGIVVWGQAVEISRVFVLQKKVIRHIFDLDYRTSCRETFIREKILTVTGVYLFKLLTYIFNTRDSLSTNCDVHTYYTRQCDYLRICKHRLTKTERSPIMAGCYFFNGLPDYIKNIESQKLFKRKLKEYLTDNCFYSVSEYNQHCH